MYLQYKPAPTGCGFSRCISIRALPKATSDVSSLPKHPQQVEDERQGA